MQLIARIKKYDYFVVRVPAKYGLRDMKNYLTTAVRKWRHGGNPDGELYQEPPEFFKVSRLVTNLPTSVQEVICALGGMECVDAKARIQQASTIRYLKGRFNGNQAPQS